MKTHQNELFGLYIHWPYCLSKCPYCDFFSQFSKHIDEPALLKAYERDLRQFSSKKPITSIYFGGGTPSLMSVACLTELMHLIHCYFVVSDDVEITLEANPDAITEEKMEAFAKLGVNRLSIGVQALDETDLRFLGRKHTVQTALEKIETAKKYFSRINMDLIYARPGQTLEAWESELKAALDLGLSHYSLYQLTIEPGTAFYKRGVVVPSDDLARAFYLKTDEIMAKAGVPAYEVSNYAQNGFESRHNMTYWLGADYVGVGPAAHGRLGLNATQNPRSVLKWLNEGTVIEKITPKERLTEQIFMALRLRNHPIPLDILDSKGVAQATKNGWVKIDNNTLSPTLEGILMLDSLSVLLIPE